MNNTINIDAIKANQKAAWMAGDFGVIAKSVDSHAREFIESCGVTPGMRVLDVACGSGNAALHAARAGAEVTGVDIATNLVEQARARAREENIRARFDEGDAEEMPYSDADFDMVVTMYGAMFAPRPEKTAAELLRVCRPGGKVAMANWTPGSFTGHMFKVSSSHVPPPPGIAPPVMWGDETAVRQRLSGGVESLRMRKVPVTIRFPFSVPETVEHFRKYFGPTYRAFESLSALGQAALRSDLEALWSKYNRATDGTTEVESEYLEVVATRA